MSCAPSNPQIREHPCLSCLTDTHAQKNILIAPQWNPKPLQESGTNSASFDSYSQHVLHSISETLYLRDACCIHSLRSKPTIASHFLEVFPQKLQISGGSLDKISQGISWFQWKPARLSQRACDSSIRTVLGAQSLCHRRWLHLKSRVKVDDDLSWWLVWRWYHQDSWLVNVPPQK